MKEIYKDFIGIYENAFSDKFCDDVIKHFSQAKIHPRSRITPNNEVITQDSIFEGDETSQKFSDFFFKKMQNTYMPAYMDKYISFRDIVEHSNGYRYDSFQVQRTLPTEGYHIFHQEWSAETPIYKNNGELHREGTIDRMLAWTLYLNDIEEGGETEFLYQSHRVSPKKGTVCIFPSFPTHFHRGNPPLKKEKWISTGWIIINSRIPAAFNPKLPTPTFELLKKIEEEENK